MAERPLGVIANLDRFLDMVEQMWEGPLDHFTCAEVEALADLMAAQRGDEAARAVICHHFYDSDEEEGELFEHLQKWPGLEDEIRRTFSSDSPIIWSLAEVERLQQEGAL
jgi:hypothetical protein